MTTLLRKIWKNHSKHRKLSEEWALAECEGEGWWRDTRDASRDQMDVRYAGVAPVERASSAPATALAVRSALHSAKAFNKKLQRVNLDISSKGIIVSDAETQENVLSISIYRISYCSADAANARVFAVVEGKTCPSTGPSESHLVHVFVCARRKNARALALSLAHAFHDAYQAWQANQESSFQSSGMRLEPWEQPDIKYLHLTEDRSQITNRFSVVVFLRMRRLPELLSGCYISSRDQAFKVRFHEESDEEAEELWEESPAPLVTFA